MTPEQIAELREKVVELDAAWAAQATMNRYDGASRTIERLTAARKAAGSAMSSRVDVEEWLPRALGIIVGLLVCIVFNTCVLVFR